MNQSDLKWPEWPQYGKEEEEATADLAAEDSRPSDSEPKESEA